MKSGTIAIAITIAWIVNPTARAQIDTWNVDVLGNTVPSITDLPDLPGYSGYTVSLRAKNPAHIVSAVDLGTNPVEWPHVSSNFGLFGPMHQHWITNHGQSVTTPNRIEDDLDSHFLFDYNAVIMLPRENNNVGASPLPDNAVDDYGLGDLMRAIVGTGNMRSNVIPLVYVVIPDGMTVEMRGEVATNYLSSRSSPSTSIVEFTIGQVPEPAAMLGGAGLLGMLVRRRRAA